MSRQNFAARLSSCAGSGYNPKVRQCENPRGASRGFIAADGRRLAGGSTRQFEQANGTFTEKAPLAFIMILQNSRDFNRVGSASARIFATPILLARVVPPLVALIVAYGRLGWLCLASRIGGAK